MATWTSVFASCFLCLPGSATAQPSNDGFFIREIPQPAKVIYKTKDTGTSVPPATSNRPLGKMMLESGYIGISNGNIYKFFNKKTGNEFQIPIDDLVNTLVSAHVGRNGNVIITRVGPNLKHDRRYECRNAKGDVLESGEVDGSELLISPDGLSLLVARPDEFTGSGKLMKKRIGDSAWTRLETPGNSYFTASFLNDGNILAVISASGEPLYAAKYDNANGSIIKKTTIQSVTGAAIYMDALRNRMVYAKDNRKIAFLAIVPEYNTNPGLRNDIHNTIVIIDSDLKISSITERDIKFSSIKFVGENEVAVTSSSMADIGTPNAGNWNPNNQIRVYDIATGEMRGSVRAAGRHLHYANYQDADMATLLLDNGMAFSYSKETGTITDKENDTVILGKAGNRKIGFSRKTRSTMEVK